MKRLVGLGVLLVVVIGAISSDGKTSTSTTSAAIGETTPAATVPATTPMHHSPHVKYTSCDQNISVGPATTCGFADNVFRAFARDIKSEGGEAFDHTIEASSEATGRTYTMVCRTRESTTLCTGGHSARVRFPLSAAEIYYRTPNPTSPETEVAPSEEPETEPEAEEEAECTNGSYTNSSGNTVCSPEESSSGAPAGATAECEDGTYSFSEHRSGTCSSHGGVATWIE
ncbi:MAG TPA: DUF3761 domain-containing protein [Solirubrobacteraceae bacterium]|jgi:hypothetical protein|nr:DUF3761 domain-containing protein [Solirubrobacteraceae bacterium]